MQGLFQWDFERYQSEAFEHWLELRANKTSPQGTYSISGEDGLGFRINHVKKADASYKQIESWKLADEMYDRKKSQPSCREKAGNKL